MRFISLLFSISIFLSGCSQLASKARINPNTVAVYDLDNSASNKRLNIDGESDAAEKNKCSYLYGESVSRRGAIDLDCFAFPLDDGIAYKKAAKIKWEEIVETGAASKSSKKQEQAKRSNIDLNHKSLLEAKSYRNRLEAVLLKRADDLCTLEKGRIFANEATINTSLGIATTTLSTVSSIVTGDLAKSILSGGAAVTSGSQDHVNANVYRNQLTQAITKAMDGNRENNLQEMKSYRPLSVIDYPVDEMIRLANRYHQSCSFENGLQTLLEAAVNQGAVDRIYRERAINSAIRKVEDRLNDPRLSLTSDQKIKLEEQLLQLYTREANLIAGTPVASEAPQE